MIAIGSGDRLPSSDGEVNLYESPELRDKRYFDRSRRVIFVNGMANSSADHRKSAHVLSTLQACPVIGVYNQTDGFWPDLGQCLADKITLVGVQAVPATFAGWAQLCEQGFQAARKSEPGLTKGAYVERLIGSNPATASLYRVARSADFRTLPIFAHSQGNLITSNALTAVALADGPAAVQNRQVNSFGSPCRFWPPGIDHRNHAFTFDPIGWMDYKFSFQSIKVGGIVAHGFEEYMRHDPEYVVNRFRWGSFGFTANMDEARLADALVEMGNNPNRLHGIFQRLLDAHWSDQDDIALAYVKKMRAKGREGVLRTMARTKPDLIRLLIQCLVGGTLAWRTGEEKAQAEFLKTLI